MSIETSNPGGWMPSALRSLEVGGVGGEPESLVAGQDTTVAQRLHEARAGPLPGEQPRDHEVGRGRLRVRAARRQAQDWRPAEAAQPDHRARVGWDAAANDLAAQLVDRDEERVHRVGAAAAGGEDEVDAVLATRHP